MTNNTKESPDTRALYRAAAARYKRENALTTPTKPTAKRIATGHYAYRGHEIYDASADAGENPGDTWYITAGGDVIATRETLRDAKAAIDGWSR